MATTRFEGVPIAKLVERYIQIRDRAKKLKAEFEQQIAPFDEALSQLEGAMLRHLHGEGGTSLKTPFGTVYIHTQTKGSIMDFDAFWEHVREHDAANLLQRRLVLSEVTAWNETHPDAPVPGIQLEAHQTARVRAK